MSYLITSQFLNPKLLRLKFTGQRYDLSSILSLALGGRLGDSGTCEWSVDATSRFKQLLVFPFGFQEGILRNGRRQCPTYQEPYKLKSA